eukprot:gnl/MRDRNA2_/MRDRNA2_88316_c0_seq1.p1 gnl/MRDRNA2_/MRDRNA2_88316_c0~~gnl/MRDRNA2_/MRDRNA2_88316_c0_seq1.p1  ORF type:complete len:655 (+),score=125.06 gnl/MRDRNA2_/MRDRNA2_88316_c0_seq1:121-2085(+)
MGAVVCSAKQRKNLKKSLKYGADVSKKVHLRIVSAKNVPQMDVGSHSDPYVEVRIPNLGIDEVTSTVEIDTAHPYWNEMVILDLEGCTSNVGTTTVIFDVHDKDLIADDFIGRVEIALNDLVRYQKHEFLLSDKDGKIVAQETGMVTILTICVEQVDGFPAPLDRKTYNSADFAKHAMIITRGTRGDVQPFVALARGLAEQLGWMVTVATELRWKSFVKSNLVGLKKGRICYRPSGGDTMKRIDGPLAKWALETSSSLVQAVMLARSEAEFFDSEPAFYHWASELKPDVIIYGFTLTHVALVLSEALKIPVMGFILQPTVIPSEQYDALMPIPSESSCRFSKISEAMGGHDFQSFLRDWVCESSLFSDPLNTMRKLRNLKPFTVSDRYNTISTQWAVIADQKLPVVCPMPEVAFGGRPSDWVDSMTFSEFIFLRTSAEKLSPEICTFLQQAKERQRPIVPVTFSSMPINLSQILEICCKVAEGCKRKPCMIATIGNKDRSQEKVPLALEKRAQALCKDGALLQVAGAPFGELFPLCDCAVVHGGLGSTAEALRAGIPVIVTGVLLMDQRFWGCRMHDLGVGPKPCFVSDFHKTCVDVIDSALERDGAWAQKAKELQAEWIKGSASGVDENVAAFAKAVENLKPVSSPVFVQAQK